MTPVYRYHLVRDYVYIWYQLRPHLWQLIAKVMPGHLGYDEAVQYAKENH